MHMIMTHMTDAMLHLVPLVLGLIIVFVVALTIHRLHFHTLARFPGPKIAAATYWYEFYYDIFSGEGGQFTFKIDDMHKQYGPIVRINPNELHIQDPEFHEQLYGGPGQVRNKYAPHATITGTTLGSFSTVDHYQHKQRRAAVSSLYSKQTVIKRQELIKRQIEELCQVIQRQCYDHGFCEVRSTYLAYSTEIINRFFFNEAAHLLGDEKATLSCRKTIDAIAFFTSYAKHITWLIPIAKRLPIALVSFVSKDLGQMLALHEDMSQRSKSAFSSLASLRTLADRKPKAHSDQGEAFSTLFEVIQSSRLPDLEKLPERMADEGIVTLAAGSESVGRALVSATFHLLDNPDSCKRPKNELREAILESCEIPDIKELEQLTYLNAVIKESLRLACITMARLPIISPNKALHYGDWIIPAGTPVAMTPHKILMDANIYPSPKSFRPERWLGTSEEVLRANQHFVVFQKGNRACTGVNLAQAQLCLAIATLFRRFNFELVDTIFERDIEPVRDCFVGMPKLESTGVKIAMKCEAV